MTEPSSFCTVATKPVAHELFLFLNTLAIYHPNATVHVLCDSAIVDRIGNIVSKNLIIKWHTELDKYSNLSRKDMEAQNIWSDFQMSKARIIDIALAEHPDTMFMDCDIIVTSHINDIDKSKQLGVSPQFLHECHRKTTGMFNGGTLWTNAKSLPDNWRKYTLTSRYYDQASIEDLANEYPHFMFGENYNFHSYRFIGPAEPVTAIKRAFKCINGVILYKNNPLKYFHTHVTDQKQMKLINKYFMLLIKKAKMLDIYKLILQTFDLEKKFSATV